MCKTIPISSLFLKILCVGILFFLGFPGEAAAREDPPSFSNYNNTPPVTVQPDPGAVPDGFNFFDAGYREPSAFGFPKNVAFVKFCGQGEGVTERVVRCIQLVVRNAVQNFFTTFGTALNSFMYAAIILAVTIYGVKIVTGSSYRPGPEAFMLLLKVAGVILFSDTLGGFLDAIFPVMETVAGFGMSYLNSGDQSPFLQGCSTIGDDATSIWVKIDCIIARMATGEVGPTVQGAHVGVLWVLAVAIFWTSFFGIFVFLMMFWAFFVIFLLVLRCVHVFLYCYIVIAFLAAMAPLMIPLILFRRTKIHFDKWLRNLIGFMIQPFILVVFMTFIFAMIDNLFFKDNEYSLASIIGVGWENPQLKQGLDAETVAERLEDYTEQTGHEPGSAEYEGYKNLLTNKRDYTGVGVVKIKLERIIDITIRPASAIVNNTFIGGIPGAEDVAGAIDDIANWGLDKLEDVLIPFNVPRIDVPESDGRSEWEVLVDILYFFLTVVLIMWLFSKYMNTWPQLMRMLTGTRTTVEWQMAGEKQVKGTIGAVKGASKGAVKGAVKGFITGGKAGAIKGAVVGAAQGARQGYKNAANNADKQGRPGANAHGRVRSGKINVKLPS